MIKLFYFMKLAEAAALVKGGNEVAFSRKQGKY
jgi:hypothetical protein